jgi:polysaccharide chain length determinant protein (PEP-CTERM system associated)
MKDLSGLDVRDYFRIFWNRRWYFLSIFALVSIGGTIYASRKPDFYRSEAKIAVDIPLSTVSLPAGSRTSSLIQERKDIIREQLSSRVFLERMIAQTGAYNWGESDGFVMERAVDAIRRSTRIDNTTDRMFRISYSATDPTVAQSVTRQLTDELIRVSKRASQDRARTTDKFFEDKFNEAEGKVKEHSEKIRLFKLENAGKLPEQALNNINAINGYRQQLISVDQAIMREKNTQETIDYRYVSDKEARALKTQLEQQMRLSSAGAARAVSGVATPEELEIAKKTDSLNMYKARLDQALSRYTENHPEIATNRREIARLEQEIAEARANLPPVSGAGEDDAAAPPLTMADIEEERRYKDYMRQSSVIEANIAGLEKERADLLKVINDYEFRLRTAPTLEQALDDLYREEAQLKKEYDYYANQKLNAGLSTAVETDKENEVYRIIDDASFPGYPESSRIRLILMSIGGGFAAGLAGAFGREILDSTIGSEEEAKKVFNLPVLAAIPAAPKKSKQTEARKTA